MNQPRIMQQKQFESLEQFIDEQNNYYAHFLKGNDWGETRRNRPHFRRFQKAHPELEREVTRKTCEARFKSERLPYEQLYRTYEIMSQLVHVDDEGVGIYSKPDEYLLG
tara:strand:+ start:226 stop:552 length:327 start_codon:yes stop_codon:yes gene_type:complete